MNWRILLIDDDDQIRRTLRAILERGGFSVAEAEDGLIGAAMFEAERFDLVVVDIIMPHQTGVETIQRLRSISSELPIIAMSGGGRMSDMRFLDVAEKLGATRVMTKPVRSETLLETVAACLNGPSSS